MSLFLLEKRVKALEAIALRTSVRGDCMCRSRRQTYYHTSADLDLTMSVPCPVHGFRDLGDLVWVHPGTPLLPEDRHLCSCPACPTRDLLEGKRGPLTKEEQEEECRSWDPAPTEDMRGKLRIERAREQVLLQEYFRKQRRHREELRR